jgi:hypothetical protein
MRSKSITLFGLLLVAGSLGANSMSTTLSFVLESKRADELKLPLYSKEVLAIAGHEYLFVTQDYGHGRELRHLFLYRRNGDNWELTAYRRTKASKIHARVLDNRLEFASEMNHVLLEIPIETLSSP